MFIFKNIKNMDFFMVFLEDRHTPTRKHSTYELAKAEAERLSATYSKKAYVLMPVASCEVPPRVIWKENKQIPF